MGSLIEDSYFHCIVLAMHCRRHNCHDIGVNWHDLGPRSIYWFSLRLAYVVRLFAFSVTAIRISVNGSSNGTVPKSLALSIDVPSLKSRRTIPAESPH